MTYTLDKIELRPIDLYEIANRGRARQVRELLDMIGDTPERAEWLHNNTAAHLGCDDITGWWDQS